MVSGIGAGYLQLVHLEGWTWEFVDLDPGKLLLFPEVTVITLWLDDFVILFKLLFFLKDGTSSVQCRAKIKFIKFRPWPGNGSCQRSCFFVGIYLLTWILWLPAKYRGNLRQRLNWNLRPITRQRTNYRSAFSQPWNRNGRVSSSKVYRKQGS